MESVKISVSGNLTSVVVPEPLVAGTVGLPVMFSFDPSWQQLRKIAVFRVSGKTMDVLYKGQEVSVPWELMAKPGCRLWAGIYGTNESGSVQIPTVWADLGVIQPGADPSGDKSVQPTLPVWQQLTRDVEEGLQAIIHLEEQLMAGGKK